MANPARVKFFGDGDEPVDIGTIGSMPEVFTGEPTGSKHLQLTAINRKKFDDAFGTEREKLMQSRGSEGWRFSKSSVSSIYHSAQDITDFMSETSEFSDPLQSPHRSYHSVHENLSYETDRDDIFSSPQGSPVHGKKAGKSVAFQDVMPLHEVDFVLVWEGTSTSSVEQVVAIDTNKEKRRIFERNLEEEGLMLEREKLEASNLTFVKIHAPIEVLRRYCEILKLRMPMKELQGEIKEMICSEYEHEENGSLFQIPQLQTITSGGNALMTEVKSFFGIFTEYFQLDPRLFPARDHKLHAVYGRDKEYLFDTDDPEFFTPLIKARIVDFIIKRKRYSEDTREDFSFGIERLLNDGVYFAAYPLHDGDLKNPGSQRYLLWTEWAALGKGLKLQPLDTVKEYFGVKIGLYFAWLGFYTHMLIPASILGFLCFLYGCFTLYQNQQSEDICNKTFSEGIYMCPLCDKLCSYWKLHETCFYARLTYLFDNYATVGFAVLMSFWTAIFLEYWKRYVAEIKHRWDLSGFDIHEEHPRPEYLARLRHVKKKEINIVTQTPEPYAPFWKMRLPYTMFSVSMIVFLICLAVAAVVAVVVYRLAFMLFLVQAGDKSPGIHSWGLILVNVSAASINLVFIFFFNWLYTVLAEYLTELELHRTQTSFDDSLTLKMYLLQFVNYYSSIFYIAFFKGKFVGSPKKYTTVFGFRQEECGPGGCMTELCIQLAIIMVGKQAMNSVLEMVWPLAMKWWSQFKIMTGMEVVHKSTIFSTQWAKDVTLLDWGPRALFPEYLEMVLQYGFVTIFVAAFPLAPFFALLNNILEMRLDAKKLITYYRRPVSQRVKDIGIWYGIMDAIAKLAVISNAFIIAFTSNFIPKLVYMYSESQNNSLEGFLEHSLAHFNTSDFAPGHEPDNSTLFHNVTVCRYQEYRSDHLQPEGQKYKRTAFYWKVWMARLAFVVVFENVVALGVMTLRWIIPDVPKKLQDKIKRESYLTNEIIIKQEMIRARGVSDGDSSAWNPVCNEKDLELVRASSSAFNNVRKRNKDEVKDTESAEVMV